MRANISLSVPFDDIPTLLSSHMVNQQAAIELINEMLYKCSTLMKEGKNPKQVSLTLVKIKDELSELIQTVDDASNCYHQYLSVSFGENTNHHSHNNKEEHGGSG